MLTEKYQTYRRTLSQFAALEGQAVDKDGVSTKRACSVTLFGNFSEGREASASVTRSVRTN